jgi:hypothetical protein
MVGVDGLGVGCVGMLFVVAQEANKAAAKIKRKLFITYLQNYLW